MPSQCHGLWDEDDITDSGTNKEESDDELSLSHGRRASSDSLKSINLAASTESIHVSFPEQPTAVRRKRSGSSSQISCRTSFSSNRSQRGIYHMISLGWNNTLRCLVFMVPVGLGQRKHFEIKQTQVQILIQLCVWPGTVRSLWKVTSTYLGPSKCWAHDSF